jgi:hypothetical protein
VEATLPTHFPGMRTITSLARALSDEGYSRKTQNKGKSNALITFFKGDGPKEGDQISETMNDHSLHLG